MQYLNIYRKASKIVKSGVSLSKCGHNSAIAFADDPVTRTIAKEHVSLSKTSNHIATYDLNVIEAGSVGCGHWNQFLAAVVDGCECPEEFRDRLCASGSKCLDGERLCKDQPALRELVTNGIRWTLIHKNVELVYPELPSLFQKR